jgi:tRNA(fMet)-specific endonuclease VapC
VIDTSFLVELERGEASPDVLGPERHAISVISVSELLSGALRSPVERRAERRAGVEQILERFDAIPVTKAVARRHAEVWAELSSRGSRIGLHDSWIGATALTYDLGVATRNPRDFERIPGLRVLAA